MHIYNMFFVSRLLIWRSEQFQYKGNSSERVIACFVFLYCFYVAIGDLPGEEKGEARFLVIRDRQGNVIKTND